MTNKLVVIVKSLKLPKIKKMLLYEMKFLVPNYSCLQNPWLGGYRPQIPVFSVLCPQLNVFTYPPPRNKIPGYATAGGQVTFDKSFYRLIFNQEVTVAPVTSIFSSLSHSSRRSLLEIYHNYSMHYLHNIIIICINNNNSVTNDN